MVYENEADSEPIVQVPCWEGTLQHTLAVQGCGGEKGQHQVKELYTHTYREHCEGLFFKPHYRNTARTFHEGLSLLR